MSRIGRKPIGIPAGVSLERQGNAITVKGPKGVLTRTLCPDIQIDIEDNQIQCTRPSDHPRHRSMHGLTRTLLNNMIEGVTNGFSVSLDILGVGYRASMDDGQLALAIGKSHPVRLKPWEGIEIEVPAQNKIIIKGIDKEKVGTFAAIVRKQRLPEPYKGKGIKYSTEVVRRKVGKTGAAKK
ncbi:MAG: 50S ribosomal protein L6 [Peptococcaceae bacterium]|jgi:large subunit ribosomal protein L6|nr:50S ribosomal protein L6 [Peptococcaceae bacterium]